MVLLEGLCNFHRLGQIFSLCQCTDAQQGPKVLALRMQFGQLIERIQSILGAPLQQGVAHQGGHRGQGIIGAFERLGVLGASGENEKGQADQGQGGLSDDLHGVLDPRARPRWLRVQWNGARGGWFGDSARIWEGHEERAPEGAG